MRELHACGLDGRVQRGSPRPATREELESFHTPEYIDLVRSDRRAVTGFWMRAIRRRGTASSRRRATWSARRCVRSMRSWQGRSRRAFIPIAGLHHAARDRAAGFCVFNDCGVAIEMLRRNHGLRRIAYVDIDAHHGDGVFYGFEGDPDVLFADLHEDGRYLYPGTGRADETGTGAAGTKLNIPLPPGAERREFKAIWPQVEDYLRRGPARVHPASVRGRQRRGRPPHAPALDRGSSRVSRPRRLCALADRLATGESSAWVGAVTTDAISRAPGRASWRRLWTRSRRES